LNIGRSSADGNSIAVISRSFSHVRHRLGITRSFCWLVSAKLQPRSEGAFEFHRRRLGIVWGGRPANKRRLRAEAKCVSIAMLSHSRKPTYKRQQSCAEACPNQRYTRIRPSRSLADISASARSKCRKAVYDDETRRKPRSSSSASKAATSCFRQSAIAKSHDEGCLTVMASSKRKKNAATAAADTPLFVPIHDGTRLSRRSPAF